MSGIDDGLGERKEKIFWFLDERSENKGVGSEKEEGERELDYAPSKEGEKKKSLPAIRWIHSIIFHVKRKKNFTKGQ